MPVALTEMLKILMEVIAAAPGIESTVEHAVTAWHASGAATPEKIATITTAATQLGQVASAIASANEPAPPPAAA
jgi:hypothetical protein